MINSIRLHNLFYKDDSEQILFNENVMQIYILFGHFIRCGPLDGWSSVRQQRAIIIINNLRTRQIHDEKKWHIIIITRYNGPPKHSRCGRACLNKYPFITYSNWLNWTAKFSMRTYLYGAFLSLSLTFSFSLSVVCLFIVLYLNGHVCRCAVNLDDVPCMWAF